MFKFKLYKTALLLLAGSIAFTVLTAAASFSSDE